MASLTSQNLDQTDEVYVITGTTVVSRIGEHLQEPTRNLHPQNITSVAHLRCSAQECGSANCISLLYLPVRRTSLWTVGPSFWCGDVTSHNQMLDREGYQFPLTMSFRTVSGLLRPPLTPFSGHIYVKSNHTDRAITYGEHKASFTKRISNWSCTSAFTISIVTNTVQMH